MSYSIGEFSKKLGISGSTIKNYEKKFSIDIDRNDKGHRVYSEKNLNLFKLIIRMKEMGASLDIIEKILVQKGLVSKVEGIDLGEKDIKNTQKIDGNDSETHKIKIREKSKSLAVINYDDEMKKESKEKKYSIKEVSQLTSSLKELQDGYIRSLKEQLERKDRQILYYEDQIQKGQDIMSKIQNLLDYEIENNKYLKEHINELDQKLIEEKNDQLSSISNKKGFWSKFKDRFCNKKI